MTEALAMLFEGHEIRVLEQDSDLWFPLGDIARAWGIDRKTPANLIDRNKELFAGMFRSDGDVTYQDVNERGLYILMGKISADRLKNKDAKKALIRFQRWVPELIQKYRKKEIVQIPENTLDLELDIAKHLSEKMGGDLAAFQAIALKRHGMEDYIPALKQTSNIKHGESGWYNVTQLCEKYPLQEIEGHPERLNNYLQNQGYIYRENGKPRLQPKGEPHGKEYWFESPHGHREIRIRWRLSIMYACGLVHDEPARLGVI